MYLKWEEETIKDFGNTTVNQMYNRGFVFTRPTEGAMEQTRSLRIDLSQFELNSENRRVLRKTEELSMKLWPLPCTVYTWEMGKLGKDFYETKFGDGTFSANKIKELLTGDRKDFNGVFVFKIDNKKMGFCIAVETDEMIHYSYPFYDLEHTPKNMGLGMMVRAIQHAKEQKKKYIYLGSFQRESDVYKLQFKGLQFFDSENWLTDLTLLKESL